MSVTQIENIYIQFLQNFPVGIQPIVSILLVVIVVYAIFRIIKKDWIFIIILVILLPGSIPILKSIWSGIVAFTQFLLNTK